jgi:CRISPR-associated protein Csx10
VLDLLRGELMREERPHLCACGARLERYRGFVLNADKVANQFRASVPRRPLVRVGLNRWTETAEDRALYVLDAILPLGDPKQPLAFTGYWEMSEPQWKTLQQLLNEFFLRDSGGGYCLRLGSARARGMGEVILHTREVAADALAARFEAFHAGLPNDGYVYCSLTARAPALVYDASGALAVELNTDTLRRYLSNLPPGLESVARGTFIERELFSGWSQAWGLPKPVAPAIAPGSVYTFRAPAAERAAVRDFLQEIETSGLGERLGEGLGEFKACDPFHKISTASGSERGLHKISTASGSERGSDDEVISNET